MKHFDFRTLDICSQSFSALNAGEDIHCTFLNSRLITDLNSKGPHLFPFSSHISFPVLALLTLSGIMSI